MLLALTAAVACAPAQKEAKEAEAVETHVLHKQDVEMMTPDSVITALIEGNNHFVTGDRLLRDAVAQLKESARDGQAPMAIVLSCIDSRVPVEMIFDMSVGDLFVSRVAGNVVSGDVLGSMEYACEHAGSKVVLVLGHESCGAVHAACECVDAGNMTQMLAKINPAIDEVAKEGGDRHSEEFQNRVVEANVKNMIAGVRAKSPILAELEESGKIKIVGAIFSLESGKVTFM